MSYPARSGGLGKYDNHRSSFTHEVCRHRTSLSDSVWEIQKNIGTDPILKWEIVKKYRKDKEGGKILQFMHAIASDNKRNEWVNQRSEYLMFVGTKKVDFFVDKSQFNFMLFIPFLFIYLFIHSFLCKFYSSLRFFNQ